MSTTAATVQADRRVIDAALRRALRLGRGVPARLARAMRYAVLGPGKRIRPILTLRAYRAAGGSKLRAVLPFCCGIEFIHTFSLIHDDLPSMDDDDFRRGRPSLHRRFSEATAILAADALFAYAFEMFAAAPVAAESMRAAVAAVCRAVGPAGMTGGQMMDVAAEPGRQKTEVGSHRPRVNRPPSEVRQIQKKKTGEFISAALVVGAILGGASPLMREKLRRAGLILGTLFQMTDDLLDSEQRSDVGRTTMVSALGRGSTARMAMAEARRATRLLGSLGPSYSALAAVPQLILQRKS